MLLSERSESNQWPRPPSLAPLGQFTLNAAGTAFGEHLRAAGAHRRLAPDPIYGSVSLWGYVCSRRAKSRPVSVLLSAHWGLLPSKFDGIATLKYTPPPASLPVWCGGGRAANGACPNTNQLPQLFCTRRCHFNGISCKFQICRPQWAEVSGITDIVFGPPGGFNQVPRRASLVNGGLGGR